MMPLLLILKIKVSSLALMEQINCVSLRTKSINCMLFNSNSNHAQRGVVILLNRLKISSTNAFLLLRILSNSRILKNKLNLLQIKRNKSKF